MTAKVCKPLLVSGPRARELLGIGHTKYWELVKSGAIEVTELGRRKMAVYRSLEDLAQPCVAQAANDK